VRTVKNKQYSQCDKRGKKKGTTTFVRSRKPWNWTARIKTAFTAIVSEV